MISSTCLLLPLAGAPQPADVNLLALLCPLLPWIVMFLLVLFLLVPMVRRGRELNDRSMRHMEMLEQLNAKMEAHLDRLVQLNEPRTPAHKQDREADPPGAGRS